MSFVGCSIAGRSYGMGGTGSLRSIGYIEPEEAAATAASAAGRRSVAGAVETEGAITAVAPSAAGAAAGASASAGHAHVGSPSPAHEFWLLLSLCHTVVPERDGKKAAATPSADAFADLSYQASSPDELALTNAARAAGYVFLSRTPEKVTVSVNGRALRARVCVCVCAGAGHRAVRPGA